MARSVVPLAERQCAARGWWRKRCARINSGKRQNRRTKRQNETTIPGLSHFHVDGYFRVLLYWQLRFSEETLSHLLSGGCQSCARKTKACSRSIRGKEIFGDRRIWFRGCSIWKMAFLLRDVLHSMFPRAAIGPQPALKSRAGAVHGRCRAAIWIRHTFVTSSVRRSAWLHRPRAMPSSTPLEIWASLQPFTKWLCGIYGNAPWWEGQTRQTDGQTDEQETERETQGGENQSLVEVFRYWKAWCLRSDTCQYSPAQRCVWSRSWTSRIVWCPTAVSSLYQQPVRDTLG